MKTEAEALRELAAYCAEVYDELEALRGALPEDEPEVAATGRCVQTLLTQLRADCLFSLGERLR